MGDSSDSSEAQRRLRSLNYTLGRSGFSHGEVTLTAEEIRHLLNRISSDEQKDLRHNLRQCDNKLDVCNAIFSTALAQGSRYVARTRLPPKYHFGTKGVIGIFIGSFAVVNVFVIRKCRELAQPKLAELWLKYGGAESPTDYATLTGFVPDNDSNGSSKKLLQAGQGLIRVAFAGSSFSEGKVTLTAKEIQHLLSRSSSDEQRDILNTLLPCMALVKIFGKVPSMAVALGVGYWSYGKLIRMAPKLVAHYRNKYTLFYQAATIMIGLCVAANLSGMSECRKRVHPKIADLLQKYGEDEWTTNYDDLSNKFREGAEGTGLVREKTSMPVATEQRANVDDTYSPRIRQIPATFAYSDTFISGTPSGPPREHLEKNGKTKTNFYGDKGLS